MTYLMRSCCRDPSAAGVTYDLVDTPLSPFNGPCIATDVTPPTPVYRTAIHEAAHALVCHLYRQELAEVRASHPAQCERKKVASPLDPTQTIALKLIGRIAEDRLANCTYRPPLEAIAPYFEKVRAIRLGACDECQAALCAVATVGPAAGNEIAAALYRQGESLAMEIIANPACWLAVRALADRLMVDGVLDGPTTHSILAEHVEFGSRSTSQSR